MQLPLIEVPAGGASCRNITRGWSYDLLDSARSGRQLEDESVVLEREPVRCHRFSVYVVVMPCKVTMDTELVTPGPLLQGKCRVRCLRASDHSVLSS